MKTIKAKVHRLPAEGLGVLLKGVYPEGNEPLEILPTDDKEWLMFGKPQHLYITTDEEIKEGDWFLHPKYEKGIKTGLEVRKADSSYFGGYGYDWEFCRKIIATTDSNLGITDHRISPVPNFVDFPQIPQSFIEDYCKAGGIDKVLVEYTPCDTCNVIDVACGKVDCRATRNGYPKLNPDNTIIIHPVEERLYSLDDMINAYNVGRNYQRTGDIDLHFDNWIKSIS